jgi:N-acetylmuramic acid 6-phosphate etherase
MVAIMPTTDGRLPLVIAVDGGGSRCTAVVARMSAEADRSVEILGRGHGGPANPRVAGHETASGSISAAIAGAFADAGLEPQPVESVCLGLAGVGRADDRDAVLAWAIQSRLGARVHVVPDGVVAFADGDGEPWGIVLIAGTGSLALARGRGVGLVADAVTDRVGGWGPLLGDEGSGHAIGLAALKAAMRMADGRGPETILLAATMRRFEVHAPADLVGRLHAAAVGRREIAGLAREVVAAADMHDPVATAIITGAAADLATHVRTLADRNDFATGVYPLRLVGGLLAGSATFRRQVVESLAASGHEPGRVMVVSDPAAAAARLAAALA